MAFYEALFNNLCENGLLNLASLARCSAVSKQWREDLAKAVPTLRALDFGDYRERVTGADVMRTLTRVVGGYLRVVDLRGMPSVSNWSEDNIVDFVREAMPGVTILQEIRFSLIVREQRGRTTPLTVRSPTCKVIMKAFCLAHPGCYDMESTIFLFNRWDRFHLDSTPQQVGIEEGAVIDVMTHLGGAPSAGAYMEDHVVSSTPPSGGTVPVDTAISVTFRRSDASEEPAALYPSRREITLGAFLDSAAPCRAASPLRMESDLYTRYNGRVLPWTDQVLGPKFHVVAMDIADVAGVGGTLEYHYSRNNGCYYGGDEHSWQRYTTQMPLAGELAVDEATRTIRFTPAAPLLPAQRYGIVLQHYAFCQPGCHSDVVIPFVTRG